jgi:flagellar P-ring protein precursor FlgI
MKTIGLTLAAWCAVPTLALAQHVKDFVEVDGARANALRGYGVVTGLAGAGDSPRDESARMLRNLLQNLLPAEAAAQQVNTRNAALVLVSAELPPFQKKGTRIDVSVSTVGDAKSLAGGELQLTDLRGPRGRQDPVVYALASGRLVVQGDGRRGNVTAATVPGGATVEHELEHSFVSETPVRIGGEDAVRKTLKLVLRRPDLTTASQLVLQLNATALTGEGGRMTVATAIDGGALLVRIPTNEEYRAVTGVEPEVNYEEQPVRWLDIVLNRPVTLYAADAAVVAINDATKAVSWTGTVKLRAGSVMVAGQGGRPSVFHVRDEDTLGEFMERIGPAIAEPQMVDVVKALWQAGLIKAEVRSK